MCTPRRSADREWVSAASHPNRADFPFQIQQSPAIGFEGRFCPSDVRRNKPIIHVLRKRRKHKNYVKKLTDTKKKKKQKKPKNEETEETTELTWERILSRKSWSSCLLAMLP